MSLRISNGHTYAQFLSGIQKNQFALTRSQAQISSGLRILRPSDDPSATARVLSLRARRAHTEAYSQAVTDGRTRLDFSASVLQDSSTLLTDIRALVIQSMNGTLSDTDRKSLGSEIAFLRDQMLELANSQITGRYVFGGTATGGAPFEESTINGSKHVAYVGNGDSQMVPVGESVEMAINVPGDSIFAKNGASGVSFAGLTGVGSGSTADMGDGVEYLDIQHTGTSAPGIAALGVALVNGGADDEVLGSQDLVIDPVEGTVSIGGGIPVAIPDPADPSATDVVVRNPAGGELHLDFSGWTGAGSTSTVTGTGQISIDGKSYTPIDFSETNLELKNEATGSVIHLDMTSITRSGEEMAHFSGAVNLFDALQGIVEALENGSELGNDEVTSRLNLGLEELDRSQDSLLGSIGVLGSRSARMGNTMERLEGQALGLEGMISELRDVDFSEAVLELTQAEQRLELVQMSGTRMISNSLLNFMR